MELIDEVKSEVMRLVGEKDEYTLEFHRPYWLAGEYDGFATTISFADLGTYEGFVGRFSISPIRNTNALLFHNVDITQELRGMGFGREFLKLRLDAVEAACVRMDKEGYLFHSVSVMAFVNKDNAAEIKLLKEQGFTSSEWANPNTLIWSKVVWSPKEESDC